MGLTFIPIRAQFKPSIHTGWVDWQKHVNALMQRGGTRGRVDCFHLFALLPTVTLVKTHRKPVWFKSLNKYFMFIMVLNNDRSKYNYQEMVLKNDRSKFNYQHMKYEVRSIYWI